MDKKLLNQKREKTNKENQEKFHFDKKGNNKLKDAKPLIDNEIISNEKKKI